MERILLNASNVEQAAERAATVLRAGGVVLYPTDTLYGLGADAFSDAAVAKIYAIKGRDEKKPLHCVAADTDMMTRYAEVNDIARVLAQKFLPGALTLILKKKDGIDTGIGKGMDTLGVRIPANAFCLALAERFGPFTATSANTSGAASPRRIDDILIQLNTAAQGIDLVIDAGELPESLPSTVVDVSGEPRILREGAISASMIDQSLGD